MTESFRTSLSLVFAVDRAGIAGRSWLCVGPLFFCFLDVFLTLQGQSDAYWSGDYSQVTEWNPLARWTLEVHPLLFLLNVVIRMGVACLLILVLRESLARPLAFVVQLGHSLGAASWLTRWGILGWVGVVVMLWLSRILLDWTWKRETLACGGNQA